MNINERYFRSIIRKILSESPSVNWESKNWYTTKKIPKPPGNVPQNLWVSAVRSLYYHLDQIVKHNLAEEDKKRLGIKDSGFESSEAVKYLKKPETMLLIDYTLPSSTGRLWVVNFDFNSMNPPAIDNSLNYPIIVSHGIGSELSREREPIARVFTNVHDSNASSLGAFATARPETYEDGTYNTSDDNTCYQSGAGQPKDPETKEPIRKSTFLRIHGLDTSDSDISPYGANTEAYERRIGIHSAIYVSKSRAGRSHGCPAVSESNLTPLLNKVQGGAFEYHYGGQEVKNIQGEKKDYKKAKDRLESLKESSGKVVNLFSNKPVEADPDEDIDSFLSQRKRQSGDLDDAIETLMDLSHIIRKKGEILIDDENKKEAPARISIAARLIDDIGFSLFERRNVVDVYEIIQALSVLSESFGEEFIRTYVREIGIMSDDSIFATDFNGLPAYASITNKIKEMLK